MDLEKIVMTKVCSLCLQERDAEIDFNWRSKLRGVRQTRCKYCQAKASQAHYQKHKQVYMKRAQLRDERIIAEHKHKMFIYLNAHPCIDCGISDIRVLEFDHIRGEKINNISRMTEDGYSWATIKAEIAKCEVRCGNCHRIKTIERGNFWRNRIIIPIEPIEQQPVGSDSIIAEPNGP